MRMLQSRGHTNFTLEAFRAEYVREFRREHFNDDVPTERVLLSEKHATHTAAAKFAVYAVCVVQLGPEVFEQTGHGSGASGGGTTGLLILQRDTNERQRSFVVPA
jgi:hypothetical protein